MRAVSVATLDGVRVELSAEDVAAFAATVRGRVLTPECPGYDESRAVWNGMIDRRPGLVVRCVGAADVVACVNYARERELLLCLKGGGHNISGLAVADGALLLDLSGMKGVCVDTEHLTAQCQAGCTLGDVDRDTQLHGLAAVLGFVSNTGIAGLTLGGGFGYLTRRYGWTSDNVRSIEIVTPDGELRRVSEAVEPELFWALRGGGGNFGAATRFEYDLYPVGPQIVGGAIAWTFDAAADVLAFCKELNESSPPEHVVVGGLRKAPPAPWLPKDVHGKLIVVMFVCDTGPVDEATERVAKIKAFGKPVGDALQPRPYTGQQALLDATQPNGRRYYWKSEYLPGFDGEMLDTVREHAEKIASPHSAILLFPLHGKLSELDEDHSAVGNRKTGAVINIAGAWDDAADDDANMGWARDTWSDIRRFSTGGTYINFLNEEEGDARIQDAYGDNLARLAEVKRRYDPGNMFRTNKNILPDL